MNRVTTFIVIVLLSVVGVVGANAEQFCTPAVPENALLEAYPYANGPLSVDQMAKLNLQPVILHRAVEVHNFYRNSKECGGGSWKLETLPVGELVLVGADGYIAYRASCGNRLVEVTPSPAAPPAPATSPATATPMGIGEMAIRVITYPVRLMLSFLAHPWREWQAPTQ